MRECDGCTKCCEGWLSGEAHGKPFSPGRPCHFVAIGEGCSIYNKRPKDPCKTYKCAWLTHPEIVPEWMKPNKIDTIIDIRENHNGQYFNIVEAGSQLSSSVLSVMIQNIMSIGASMTWKIGQTPYFLAKEGFFEPPKEDVNTVEKVE